MGGYANKTIQLGVLLGRLFLPAVPSFLESCIKLAAFAIPVSFATLTGGGDGGRSATADEVRIILLAVLVASSFQYFNGL